MAVATEAGEQLLTVVEVKPSPAGCIIDADVEVDVDLQWGVGERGFDVAGVGREGRGTLEKDSVLLGGKGKEREGEGEGGGEKQKGRGFRLKTGKVVGGGEEREGKKGDVAPRSSAQGGGEGKERGTEARELVPLSFGERVKGSVREGEWKYFKLQVDSKTAQSVSEGKLDITVDLTTGGKADGGKADRGGTSGRSGQGGSGSTRATSQPGHADIIMEADVIPDADVYASLHPLVFPTVLDFHARAVDSVGSKALSLSSLERSVASVLPVGSTALASAPQALQGRQQGSVPTGNVPTSGVAARSITRGYSADGQADGLLGGLAGGPAGGRAGAEAPLQPGTYTVAVRGYSTCSCSFTLSVSLSAAAADASGSGVGGTDSSAANRAAVIAPVAPGSGVNAQEKEEKKEGVRAGLSSEQAADSSKKSGPTQHGGGCSEGTVEAVPAGSVLCSHCKQAVPEHRLQLHEAYCARHNVVCDYNEGGRYCGAVVRRVDMEAGRHKHCDVCGVVVVVTQGGGGDGEERGGHEHCGVCGVVAAGRQLREKHERVVHGEVACECGAKGPASEMVSAVSIREQEPVGSWLRLLIFTPPNHPPSSLRPLSILCLFSRDLDSLFSPLLPSMFPLPPSPSTTRSSIVARPVPAVSLFVASASSSGPPKGPPPPSRTRRETCLPTRPCAGPARRHVSTATDQ